MFEQIFKCSPLALILVSSDGRMKYVNNEAERLFGYSKDEMEQQPIEMLIPPEFKTSHPKLRSHFFKTPESRSMGKGRDLFGIKKNGDRFPIEVGLNPIHSEGNVYVVSSIVEISERIKDKERLMSRNEELQQFTYRTSHDLKAPLISIRGLAEFIIEDIDSGGIAEVKNNAGKILNLSDRLKNLLEDILSLTKADYLTEDVVEISLSDILANARMKLEISAKENHVEIIEKLENTAPLYSQPTVIAHIIDNLLSNAIKYANKDRSNSQAVIRTFNQENRFFIEVHDNGVGIPKNKQAEVFGMFKRFHHQSIQGSGLGLYLVKKYVQKLGGTISFESSEDGTVFLISLPSHTN